MTNKQLAKKLREAAVLEPRRIGFSLFDWISARSVDYFTYRLLAEWLTHKRDATNTERGMFLLFCAHYLESES